MSGEQAPALQEFRVEVRANGIAHLIFDMPDRSTNVFSRAAISDFERFVAWLGAAPDIRGAVIRSGKAVYMVSDATGFPAYLGGPFALLSYLGGDRLAAIDAHIRKR